MNTTNIQPPSWSFSFAAAMLVAVAANAQNSTTPTTTGQTQSSPWAVSAPSDLQDPLKYYRQNFAGFEQPVTVPLHYIEAEVGLNYDYQRRSRDDVQRTWNKFTPSVELMFGLPYNLELGTSLPFYYNTLSVKDSTGKDSHDTSGIDNVRAWLKYNITGNDGGRFALSAKLTGQFATANSFGDNNVFRFNDFGSFSSGSRDDNRRRDNNRSEDVFGVGGSLQATMNLPYGIQAGINSGAFAAEPWCYCCLDNRFSVTKSLCCKFSAQATVATSLTTARRSEVQGVLYGALNYQPTSGLGFSVGPIYNFTRCGSNIGAGFQASYAAKAW